MKIFQEANHHLIEITVDLEEEQIVKIQLDFILMSELEWVLHLKNSQSSLQTKQN